MKRIFLTLALAFGMLGLVGFVAQPAFAATADPAAKKQACESLGSDYSYDAASGGCSNSTETSSPQDMVGNIITLFSWAVGAISVVMLIFAGFKYVTAAGDAGKITNAKNTLIYALIGIVVVVLSQLIVNFVLFKTNCSVQPNAKGCTTNQKN